MHCIVGWFDIDGWLLATREGATEGELDKVGFTLGTSVGLSDGVFDGSSVGIVLGTRDGVLDGYAECITLGERDGDEEGMLLGD